MSFSTAGAIAQRVGQALLTLWVASVLVWTLLLLAPGDPARAVLAANDINFPTRLQVHVERAKLGLNGSPVNRYWHWLIGVLHGRLGTSWADPSATVAHQLLIRLPATLVLTTAAFGMSLVLALILALVSVWAPRQWPDRVVRTVNLIFLSAPSFLVGTLLLNLIVVRWGHFEVITNGNWNTVFLPALTLSLGTAASWSRILRASLLEATAADYLDVALARGVGKWRAIAVHALPNSLVSFLTVMAVGVAALLGGTPIVETVFSWPGVGAYFVQSITASDIPVIQGFTLFAILAYVVFSMLVDIATVLIDPRLAPSGQRPRLIKRRQSVPAGAGA